jgi:hypothetical protein
MSIYPSLASLFKFSFMRKKFSPFFQTFFIPSRLVGRCQSEHDFIATFNATRPAYSALLEQSWRRDYIVPSSTAKVIKIKLIDDVFLVQLSHQSHKVIFMQEIAAKLLNAYDEGY